jgi:hypothetical protein
MLANYAIAQQRPASRLLILRYEDLISDLDLWLDRVFEFVNIKGTQAVMDAARIVSSLRHAPLARSEAAKTAMTRSDAMDLARRVPECIEVARTHRYAL